MLLKWDRLLPVDEMLADRWKKAKLVGSGRGTSIYESSLIYGKPKIGKNVWIGSFTIIDATGGLEIGDGCDISCGVHIYSHSTQARCTSERKKSTEYAPVVIGDYVFVGANAVILPGVHIGHHSTIGSGAVVTKDVSPHSVAVGVPAHVLRNNTKS